jgi:hypothetical protein
VSPAKIIGLQQSLERSDTASGLIVKDTKQGNMSSRGGGVIGWFVPAHGPRKRGTESVLTLVRYFELDLSFGRVLTRADDGKASLVTL